VQTRRRGRHAGVGKVAGPSPDIFIEAETVVFPKLSIPNDPVASPGAPAVSVLSPAPTVPLRLVGADSAVSREVGDRGYTPSKRRTMVSRLALLGICCLQALMSLRLQNTAFEDEALYLYAGHMELEHLLHGAALQGSYASYFSGAPVLYPVVAAALNAVGGLALARALSLVEMLAVTAILYSFARFLFNERVALCSAALFSVCESAIFLGHLATFDATCVFLLASATWIVVRWSGCRWPVFLLAAPLVALAVAVKYAGGLFLPTIAVLPAIAGWQAHGRRALLFPPAFVAVVAGLLYGGLRLGGHAYAEAISGTTTNRAQGVVSAMTIAKESAEWGGAVTLLALAGAVAYTMRPRTEPDEQIAPSGGRWQRAALGAVLAGSAFLAPAYQMHLHTDVSLLKHVGFGLFFAAPMAGLGLVRLVGDHFRRPQLGIAVWCVALVLGMSQSSNLYHAWPSSGTLVKALSAYLRPDARYLVEVPEVPIYYLQGRADAQPDQFWSTYTITYVDSKGQTLTGNAGFAAAIRAGFFREVAYSGDVTPATDAVIASALKSSPSYQLAEVVHMTDSSGPVDYYVWVKGLSSHTRPAVARPLSPQMRFGQLG
jgi:Dolichyl-phosphate-mannose-protein mannosyltransferase